MIQLWYKLILLDNKWKTYNVRFKLIRSSRHLKFFRIFVQKFLRNFFPPKGFHKKVIFIASYKHFSVIDLCELWLMSKAYFITGYPKQSFNADDLFTLFSTCTISRIPHFSCRSLLLILNFKIMKISYSDTISEV